MTSLFRLKIHMKLEKYFENKFCIFSSLKKVVFKQKNYQNSDVFAHKYQYRPKIGQIYRRNSDDFARKKHFLPKIDQTL